MSSRFVQTHENHLQRSYAPSFFNGDRPFLNDTHSQLEELVEPIRGKLEKADHFKLYEIGYFSRGPVLEIGRLHGKSTVLLALGVRDGSAPGPVVSIEREDRYLPWAVRHLKKFGLSNRVELIQGDSSAEIQAAGGTFDSIFLDGDTSYEGASRDLDAMLGRVRPRGVVAVHNYFHQANESGEYGVKRAVDERVDRLGLSFRGRFGGIALYERTR